MHNYYPSQYKLPELTAHITSLLERRRRAFDSWDEKVELALRDEAETALEEAGKQFREIADDEMYWANTSQLVMSVVLPRYFKLARTQQEVEQQKYGIWRGGDFVARATFAVVGLILGFIILRAPIPNWFQIIPLLLFILGPLLPDFQVRFAKHRYNRELFGLVDEMRAEAAERQTYAPWGTNEANDVLANSITPSTTDRIQDKT